MFILTVWLVGTNISFTDPNTYITYRDCKREGQRQVEGFKDGNMKAAYDCDQTMIAKVEEPVAMKPASWDGEEN